MGWRVVHISKDSYLRFKNHQLVYKTSDNINEEITLPLEDIAVIIADNAEINFSSVLLRELANYGIALFTCDASHIPNGLFLPFHQHSRYSEILALQINWGEPFKKRIWQRVVAQKIANQAAVIEKVHGTRHHRLLKLSQSVLSGDPDNCEAQAAREYWDNLFANFRRGHEDIKNKALNYGYAILRGCVARNLVASGFLPALGLHHANNLNAFNLADDIIEPFRPFIDEIVFHQFQNLEHTDLKPADKQRLLAVLSHICAFDQEQITLLKAIERTAETLQKATREKDHSKLILPKTASNNHLK